MPAKENMTAPSEDDESGRKDLAQECLKSERVFAGLYEHYKGGLYVVFAKSVDEATLLPMVHYYIVQKKTRWTRRLDDFTAQVKDSTNTVRDRFKRLRKATSFELAEAAGFDEVLRGLRTLKEAYDFGQDLFAEYEYGVDTKVKVQDDGR